MHPLVYLITGILVGLAVSYIYRTFQNKSSKEEIIIDIQVNSKNAIKEINKLQDAVYVLEQRIKKLQ